MPTSNRPSKGIKMDKKQFISEMKKLDVTVACGKAGEWIGSRQHAENWNQGGCGRRVAYSVYSTGYKAWIEPKKSYENWAEAFENYIYEARR